MQFFIIRSSPIFMALTFLVGAHLLRYVYDQWEIIFGSIAALVVVYFGWLAWRLERVYFWPFLLYALALFGVGMGSIMFLSNQLIVQLLIIGWTALVLIFFEGLFHYLYQTDKRSLVDIGQVLNYYNGIIFFAFIVVVVNGVVFLRFNSWLAWIIIGVMAALLFFTQLRIKKASRSSSIALLVGLMSTQFIFAFHFLSLGVHVVAATVTLGFYWVTSLILAHFEGILTQRRFISYSVVTIALLLAVLLSAQWL